MRDSVMKVLLVYASVHCTCCLRVSGRAIGVEVSHDNVITEVKKKVKVMCKI